MDELKEKTLQKQGAGLKHSARGGNHEPSRQWPIEWGVG